MGVDRRCSGAASVVLALGGLTAAFAGEGQRAGPYTLAIDPFVSFDTGVGLTQAATTGLAELEACRFPLTRDRGAGAVTFRLFRALLLDHPLATWLVVLQHEAFGHGGRAREFGSEASVHMGSPWRGRSSYATFDTEGLATEDLLRISSGGGEANGFSATCWEREAVAGRAFHAFELWHLIRSRWAASQYVLLTTPDPVDDPAGFHAEWSGGGDVARYLGYRHTLDRGEPGITPSGVAPGVLREYRRLERQARWAALDPGAWLALWGAGRQILLGDEPRPLRLPRAFGRRLLPIFSADWLPDGPAMSLEVVVGPRPEAEDPAAWRSLTLRRGEGTTGAFGAVGVARERVIGTRWLRLGGEAELWTRPGEGPGGGARARIGVADGPLAGLFVGVGVKSDGHWPGRPAERGPFLTLGYRTTGVY